MSKLKISPDQRKIITVGSEGAVFFWDMPESVVKSSVKGSVKGSKKK